MKVGLFLSLILSTMFSADLALAQSNSDSNRREIYIDPTGLKGIDVELSSANALNNFLNQIKRDAYQLNAASLGIQSNSASSEIIKWGIESFGLQLSGFTVFAKALEVIDEYQKLGPCGALVGLGIVAAGAIMTCNPPKFSLKDVSVVFLDSNDRVLGRYYTIKNLKTSQEQQVYRELTKSTEQVVPVVIISPTDLQRLREWQSYNNKPRCRGLGSASPLYMMTR